MEEAVVGSNILNHKVFEFTLRFTSAKKTLAIQRGSNIDALLKGWSHQTKQGEMSRLNKMASARKDLWMGRTGT